MTEQDFTTLYNEDVDFKDLVEYTKALAKVNMFFVELSAVKFDKLTIGEVHAKDVQLILDSMYRKKVQGFLEEKTTEKILKYADKLLSKETRDGIQPNVHDGQHH